MIPAGAGPVVCNAHRHRPFNNKCVWCWLNEYLAVSGQPTPNQRFQRRYKLSRHLASIHSHSVRNLPDNDALLPLPLDFVHARSRAPQVVCPVSICCLLHLLIAWLAAPRPGFFPQTRFSMLLRRPGGDHPRQKIRLAVVVATGLHRCCLPCLKAGHYSVAANYSAMFASTAHALLLSRKAV